MKSLFYLSLFLFAFSACEEDDDDSGMPLVYTICSAELRFSDTDKTNVQALLSSEIPTTVLAHVAAEFPGFEISNVSSFETNSGDMYIEVIANNNGVLLFDASGIFLCGDESFQIAGDDEYINIDSLPQNIKDYIAENYPGVSIDEAEIEDNEYEIELSNGTKLYFDLAGNFLREE